MSGSFDIQDVIEKSTSQVSLDDLERKGVKRVKVLNQAAIHRLINEAVDRVMNERSQTLDDAEREKIIEQSREKFETLAKDELNRERSRVASLESKLRDLEQRAQVTNEEREALADAAAQVRELTEDRDRMRGDLLKIQKHVAALKEREADLERLAEKLSTKAKELVSKEEGIREREEALQGRDQEIAAKSDDLAKRTSALTSKASELSSKVEGLAQQSQEFSAREAVLKRRARELDEARAEIDSRGGASEEELEQLRENLAERDRFLSRLEGEITAKNEEIVRLSSGKEGGDVGAIQRTLESLQKSIASMGRGGGVIRGSDVDAETLLKFANTGDDQSMESNIDKIEIKKAKSAGVKSSLARLKELNKGV